MGRLTSKKAGFLIKSIYYLGAFRDSLKYLDDKTFIEKKFENQRQRLKEFIILVSNIIDIDPHMFHMKMNFEELKLGFLQACKVRCHEIEVIFNNYSINILSDRRRTVHWLILLTLFLMDGIITRNVLEMIVGGVLQTVEILILSMGLFAVLFAFTLNLIGISLRNGNKRLVGLLSAIILLIFVFLTYMRVIGLSDPAIIINSQSLTPESHWLMGLTFFSIYILSAIAGIYNGYISTYPNVDMLPDLANRYNEIRRVLDTVSNDLNYLHEEQMMYQSAWQQRESLKNVSEAVKRGKEIIQEAVRGSRIPRPNYKDNRRDKDNDSSNN